MLFPDHWGSDSLTAFVDGAIRNMAVTSHNNSVQYPHVVHVDEVFEKIPSALFRADRTVEAALLVRSHASFRAAAMLAMAGMNPEAFVQARGCLENALYALHMHQNPSLQETWFRRHDDEASLKASRDSFSANKIFATLKEQSPYIEERERQLYDRAIDFGGHPNERSVTGSTSLKDTEEGGKTFLQSQLDAGDVPQQHSLIAVARTGVCALLILRLIFKERFDILGATAELEELQRKL